MIMSITDPTQLVSEFKKSGEFDRLRRELLSQFKNDESITTFTSRVHDIIQQRLAEDERLQYLPPDAVHSELMQDMDRFPLVQRAVADLPALKDPSFSASIRRSLADLLRDGPSAVGGSRPDAENEDVDMDESEASDTESSDEEHEQEYDQEQEQEHDHEEGIDDGLFRISVPDDMPQASRIRQPPTDLKHHTLVNGIGASIENDKLPSASPEPEAAPSQENHFQLQQDR